MVPAALVFSAAILSFVLVHQGRVLAALVTVTIEDYDHVIDYGNCKVFHHNCDPHFSRPSACNNGTSSITTVDGSSASSGCDTLRVNFIGTAIYAYLGCTQSTDCQFKVDDTGAWHPASNTTDSGTVEIALSYFNNSLPNGTHFLLVSKNAVEILVDKFIYTFEDGKASPSELLNISRTSSTSDMATGTRSSLIPSAEVSTSRNHLNVAAIVGGVLGGLILGAALTVSAYLLRRRWQSTTIPLNIQPYPPDLTGTDIRYQPRRKIRTVLTTAIGRAGAARAVEAMYDVPPQYHTT
ncbi:hypothetical protein R3P38DRAFT_1036008 [Favolaschia claudopus]|uniref:Uncharacterized protein n=1 Tax=Favolaschia claudopus TaxID=2862362 RepID=A0AAW0BIZ2_9AGAR